MVWILPLLSQHRVTWPSWRIISLLFVFTLLLVRRIFALGTSYFRRLLGVVLQVDAESICALTTFDFLPCMRCRLAKYFLAKWAVSHSVTKPSSPMSSETKVDCCCRDCRRVPLLQTRVKWQVMPHFFFSTYFSHCRAVLLTGLLMFPTTPKTLWRLQRFACEVDLLLLSILGCFHQLIRRGRGYLECFGGFDHFS